MINETQLGKKTLKPFLLTTVCWFVLGALACWLWSAPPRTFSSELVTMMSIGMLGLTDLYATAKVISAMLQLTLQLAKNSLLLVFQASYWAVIKLGCLALLVIMVLRLPRAPSSVLGTGGAFGPGFLSGLAVFLVIPVFGGIAWHLANPRDTRSQVQE